MNKNSDWRWSAKRRGKKTRKDWGKINEEEFSMNYYINAYFRNSENKDLFLYPIDIDEDTDSIRIITEIRQPSLKRGDIGDLIFVSCEPLHQVEMQDIHKDMLLAYIDEVWTENISDPTVWRYVFLKN